MALEILAREGRCNFCPVDNPEWGSHLRKDIELLPREEMSSEQIWHDHGYDFRSGNLLLNNWVSADGIDDVRIWHSDRSVYRNFSYDGKNLGEEFYQEDRQWQFELEELHKRIVSKPL